MYMTPLQIRDRLASRYSITFTPGAGDHAVAEEAFAEHAPFTVDLDGTLPESLLDWISLKSYVISQDEPGAVSEDSMSPFTRRYARPEPTRNNKRLDALIAPYLAHKARIR